MKILLAAYDRDFLNSYKILMSEKYKDVNTAFDGAQAMTLLQDNKYDVVVLDSRLPRIRNADIVKKLKTDQTPYIMLTDRYSVSEETEDLDLNDLYLRYPFSPDMLIEKIDKVTKSIV